LKGWTGFPVAGSYGAIPSSWPIAMSFPSGLKAILLTRRVSEIDAG
jgi:hypothetical protein